MLCPGQPGPRQKVKCYKSTPRTLQSQILIFRPLSGGVCHIFWMHWRSLGLELGLHTCLLSTVTQFTQTFVLCCSPSNSPYCVLLVAFKKCQSPAYSCIVHHIQLEKLNQDIFAAEYVMGFTCSGFVSESCSS